MTTTSVLSSGFNHSTLPQSYVRPESQRPCMSEVVDSDDLVPVIDMSCTDRNVIVHQIGEACRLYGFFQVLFSYIQSFQMCCYSRFNSYSNISVF